MADIKIRAAGRHMAALLVGAGWDLADLEPGADGWHTSDTMTAAVAEKVRASRAAAASAPQQAMSVDEALTTGRIMAAEADYWRRRAASDPVPTTRLLASLSPSALPPAWRDGGWRAVFAPLDSDTADYGELFSTAGPRYTAPTAPSSDDDDLGGLFPRD